MTSISRFLLSSVAGKRQCSDRAAKRVSGFFSSWADIGREAFDRVDAGHRSHVSLQQWRDCQSRPDGPKNQGFPPAPSDPRGTRIAAAERPTQRIGMVDERSSELIPHSQRRDAENPHDRQAFCMDDLVDIPRLCRQQQHPKHRSRALVGTATETMKVRLFRCCARQRRAHPSGGFILGIDGAIAAGASL